MLENWPVSVFALKLKKKNGWVENYIRVERNRVSASFFLSIKSSLVNILFAVRSWRMSFILFSVFSIFVDVSLSLMLMVCVASSYGSMFKRVNIFVLFRCCSNCYPFLSINDNIHHSSFLWYEDGTSLSWLLVRLTVTPITDILLPSL